MADPDPIRRSLKKLAFVGAKGESVQLPATLKGSKDVGARAEKQALSKIQHRQVSFAHESVHVSPSPKYSRWPDGLIKRLDLQRLEQDRKRGYQLEVVREDNVIRGKRDPFTLAQAGSPGNLMSGYGNNRKMFNNVRLDGD